MLRIMGKSKATVEQLQTYIKKVNPKVTDSVTKLAAIYIAEGEAEGVRGDIAFAQSCLEILHSADQQWNSNKIIFAA